MRPLIALLLVSCGRIGFDDRVATGDGATADAAPIGFSHLVVYANQTCAMFAGRAYCWGNSPDGQVGTGTFGLVASPQPVVLPTGTVDDLTQGENHMCAIVDGALYCAGNLQMPNVSSPIQIALPTSAHTVAAGRDFTCA